MVDQAIAVKMNRAEMFGDFCMMANKCCACGDYDPFHLLLREAELGMDQENALWFSCLFIAHYNPGSAYLAFHSTDYLKYKEWDLPIEGARRALHGGRIYEHLEDLCKRAREAGGLYQLFTRGFTDDHHANWGLLRSSIGSVYGSGRWAEYTFGEILQKVHGFPVKPTDMGNEGSTGPRNGLILLMGAGTDEAGEALYKFMKPRVIAEFFDYAVLESLACDFNSLNKGKYYIGRDIDRQQHRIRRAEERSGKKLTPLWEMRARIFQHRYLGEIGGWEGIDKKRLRIYKKTGNLIDRCESPLAITPPSVVS